MTRHDAYVCMIDCNKAYDCVLVSSKLKPDCRVGYSHLTAHDSLENCHLHYRYLHKKLIQNLKNGYANDSYVKTVFGISTTSDG